MMAMRNGNELNATTVAYSRTIPDAPEILVFGDSLGYGVGTSSRETSFAYLIGQKFPDHSIVNRSEIGAVTAEVANEITSLVDKEFDMIFLFVGGNDVARYGINLEESKQHLTTIYEHLAAQAHNVYTYSTSDFKNAGIIPSFARDYYSTRSRDIRDHSIELAARYPNITYVDAFDIPNEEYDTYEAPDGFHLNDAGIRRLVELTFSD